MPPTQRPIRFTAQITVAINDYSQLAEAMQVSLIQAFRAVASAPSVPAPPQPLRDPIQAQPVPISEEIEQGDHLLDTKQVAKLLNIGERTLWRYWNSGRVLRPIRIGGLVRWNASELHRWIEAGCPRYEKWVKG